MPTADRFPQFIERILDVEGGFTCDRRDPGNWTGGQVGVGKLLGTKFGIAANTHGDLDIPNLTRVQAVDIYRRDFWLMVGADQLPPVLGYMMLDAAVQHGIRTAKRMLQRAAGVADDGVIGIVSRNAIQSTPADDLALRFFAERIRFYCGLSTFDTYGRGWMLRMAAQLRFAALDN